MNDTYAARKRAVAAGHPRVGCRSERKDVDGQTSPAMKRWGPAPANAGPLLEIKVRPSSGRSSFAVATMISEVYDAFIAAGAPEEKACRAVEALADYRK